jgi:hypothetical protein
MQGRGRRNLFLGLLIVGALLGMILPWLVEGSLRLSGIGLPVGFIFGLLAYVVLDLLLSPAGPSSESLREGSREDEAAGGPVSGRRQLLILAVFSAIVAHFVEIHFGIAIVSTMTLFWTLAGLLVAVGMGWVGHLAAAAYLRPEARPAELVGAPGLSAKVPMEQPASASKGQATRTEPLREGSNRDGSQTRATSQKSGQGKARSSSRPRSDPQREPLPDGTLNA